MHTFDQTFTNIHIFRVSKQKSMQYHSEKMAALLLYPLMWMKNMVLKDRQCQTCTPAGTKLSGWYGILIPYAAHRKLVPGLCRCASLQRQVCVTVDQLVTQYGLHVCYTIRNICLLLSREDNLFAPQQGPPVVPW